MAATVINQ